MRTQRPRILDVVARRVRERRIALNLTQQELADRAHLSRSYVSEVELGKRNLGLINLGKLADALAIPPAKLLE